MTYDTRDIERILNIYDDTVEVYGHETDGQKDIYLVRKIEGIITCCEECGSRMESKGPRFRLVKHQIFQDGRELYLKVQTRKWHCRNCDTYRYDNFAFLEKSKQITALTDLIILDKMKDLHLTAVQVARDMNVSDTYVHETFMRYVDLPRLPLCRILCIDEVYLKFDKNNLYSVVLMNWETGEIIDILPNRYRDTIRRYFNSIPRSEKDAVEYIVSDMYDTYSSLAGTVFRNARSVIDCFHHTQPLISKIQSYIRSVIKRYQERDRKKLYEENDQNNRNYKTRKDSREVYLLKHYDYFLLKNKSDISYTPYFRHISGRGGYWFYPDEIEKEFMALDHHFPIIRELKEMYICFTHSHINDLEGAAEELDKLIEFYRHSDLSIFREFSYTLENHREGIINSFVFQKADRSDANHEILRRISSGPLEAFNNEPKDFKRQSNGITNFSYSRNRILWSVRDNPSIRGVPYSKQEVHTTGKKRGPYKKKQ